MSELEKEKGIIILMADDTRRSALNTLLQKKGFSYVENLSHPENALALLKSERFGIVVVDQLVDEKSAAEFIQDLRLEMKERLQQLHIMRIEEESADNLPEEEFEEVELETKSFQVLRYDDLIQR